MHNVYMISLINLTIEIFRNFNNQFVNNIIKTVNSFF
jgi:hypothetical protein